MELRPCLLDKWLGTYEHGIEFNLAASTGPACTLNEILSLASDEEREFFLNHKVVYSHPAGTGGCAPRSPNEAGGCRPCTGCYRCL